MPQAKKEIKTPILEFRADQEKGEIRGYFALWNTLDAHNTMFQRGCFSKSIKERKDKIVIRNDHGNPIGKPLEIIEDERGAFFVGQISMDNDEGRNTFVLIRDQVVSGLSFAFRKIQDKFNDSGIRVFTEVALLEISPTWLPSGDDSRITGFRTAYGDDVEERSTDFQQTVLENTAWMLDSSLWDTLWENWWLWRNDGLSNEELMANLDKALGDFHAAYLDFASKILFNEDDSQRNDPFRGLAASLADHLESEKLTLEQFTEDTKLTTDSIQSLCRNIHITDPKQAVLLPSELKKENNLLRNLSVERMFTDLRSYLTSAESTRAKALINTLARSEKENNNNVIDKPSDSLNSKGSDILAKLEQINSK